MNNIKKFQEFDIDLYESYLESNFAPIYHITSKWSMIAILQENKIQQGFFEIKTNNGLIKAISLTRNENLKIENREFDVSFVLDVNKLRNKYSIKPYDFFINQKLTDLNKIESNLRNTLKIGFESEEYIESEIEELNRYILRIDFFNLSDFYESEYILKNYIKKYPNIEVFLISGYKLTKLL